MTRMQAISRFTELVPKLSDEQLESILELSGYLAQSEDRGDPSEEQRASIAAGLRDLREGRLVDAEIVHADIASRIAKARGG